MDVNIVEDLGRAQMAGCSEGCAASCIPPLVIASAAIDVPSPLSCSDSFKQGPRTDEYPFQRVLVEEHLVQRGEILF